jgi:hypothetical protein
MTFFYSIFCSFDISVGDLCSPPYRHSCRRFMLSALSTFLSEIYALRLIDIPVGDLCSPPYRHSCRSFMLSPFRHSCRRFMLSPFRHSCRRFMLSALSTFLSEIYALRLVDIPVRDLCSPPYRHSCRSFMLPALSFLRLCMLL